MQQGVINSAWWRLTKKVVFDVGLKDEYALLCREDMCKGKEMLNYPENMK